MALFNTILPNQPGQYILVINILVDIIFLFLFHLKFSSNISGALIYYIKQYNNFLKLLFDCFITCIVFNTTCYIEMDSFSATSKAVILVAIYIVLCLQNKTFVDKVPKHSGSGNCCGKCAKNLAALFTVLLFQHSPDLFFRYNVTFYRTETCQVHFIAHF